MSRWHNLFINMTKEIALMSNDPNTKVGAVIIKGKMICGVGYNGFPKGIENFTWDREGEWLNTKYPYVIHAEMNAILNSNIKGDTLYCSLFPCHECAKAMVQYGIKTLYYIEDKYPKDVSYIASKKLLTLSNININRI